MIWSSRVKYLLPFALPVALCSSSLTTDDDASARKPVKQVAIIGGGAAGASTAYHLHQYAEQEGITINITLFEKRGRIGGRSTTENAYGDPAQPVELGASIFVRVNEILWNATEALGLELTDPDSDEVGILGIWDGDKFVYQQDSESSEWWSLAKLFWKYGLAPYYTRNAVRETLGTFLRLYQEPYFPFRSLTARVYELGLHKLTGVTGQQFLAEKKLDGPFARDIVQTGTRVNYASNLAYIHGMGTMVSMAAEGAVAVVGGNWQIFSRMAQKSGAHVQLNTTVASIARKGPASSASKYVIKTTSSTSPKSKAQAQDVEFDDVVIATPYQFSGITHEDNLMEHPIESIPYATLHVTLFATPFRLSGEFFGLEPGTEAPISVLTTLGEGEEPRPGTEGAGKAGFYSATLVKVVTNPKTQGREYVYKIFSPEAVTAGFLSSLLGVKVPETFTQAEQGSDQEKISATNPISWYHPTVFKPYPQKLPRVTFQDPILGQGLYYTSGIESFISTMETSALMGRNVARLIVDDYLGLAPSMEGPGDPATQHVLQQQSQDTAGTIADEL